MEAYALAHPYLAFFLALVVLSIPAALIKGICVLFRGWPSESKPDQPRFVVGSGARRG